MIAKTKGLDAAATTTSPKDCSDSSKDNDSFEYPPCLDNSKRIPRDDFGSGASRGLHIVSGQRSERVNDATAVNGVNGVNGLDTIDAPTLILKEFPALQCIVEGLIVPGLSVFGGRPKCGKSWWGLNLAIAVASGGLAFGAHTTTSSGVLYLALEDSERRLKERLNMICTALNLAAPDQLRFRTGWRRFDEGGFDDLREYLSRNPETKLLIIDTLQRVRSRPRGGKDTYASDYQELGELQQIALRYGVAILVMHHTTKAVYADPFDSLSGTTGITGSADALYVLLRVSGGDYTLYMRNRDLGETETAMRLDPATGVWASLGDAATVQLSAQRQKILDAFVTTEEWLSPKEIAKLTELSAGSVRHLCPKMTHDGLLESGRSGNNGKYRKVEHGRQRQDIP